MSTALGFYLQMSHNKIDMKARVTALTNFRQSIVLFFKSTYSGSYPISISSFVSF